MPPVKPSLGCVRYACGCANSVRRSAYSAVFSWSLCLHRMCRPSGWRLSPCSAGISWCCTSGRFILRCSPATCKPGQHMPTGCPCSDSCCWSRWPSNRCVHPRLDHVCSAAQKTLTLLLSNIYWCVVLVYLFNACCH